MHKNRKKIKAVIPFITVILIVQFFTQPVFAMTELKYADSTITDNLRDVFNFMLVDWDDNGDLDLVANHYYSQCYTLYTNVATDANGYPVYEEQATDLSFLDELSDIEPVITGDGTFDIIAKSDSEIRMYRNGGSVGSPSFTTNYDNIDTLEIPSGHGGLSVEYADLNGDGKRDIVASSSYDGYDPHGLGSILDYPYKENMGQGKGYDENGNWLGKLSDSNLYIYLNTGTNEYPSFSDYNILTVGGSTIIQHYNLTDLTVYDLNSDGKKDLIVFDDNDKLTYYYNAGNSGGIPYFNTGVDMIDAGYNSGHLENAYRNVRLKVTDIDADDDPEIMMGSTGCGRFIAGELSVSNTVINEYSIQSRNDRLWTDSLPVPDFGDLNGDGLIDFISGDASGYITFFENIGTASNPGFASGILLQAGGSTIKVTAGVTGSVQGPRESVWGYTSPFLFDWDSDGDLDILMSDIKGEHTFYENTGTTTNYNFAAGIHLQYDGQDLKTHWRAKPAAIKVGSTNYYIALDEFGYLTRYQQDTSSGDRYLINKTWMYFDDATSMPIRMDVDAGGEGRLAFEPVDWDSDGDYDLLFFQPRDNVMIMYEDAYNNYAQVALLINTGTNVNPLYDSTLKILTYNNEVLHPLGAHTAAPTMADIDNDGILDLLVAEEVGGFLLFSKSEVSTVDVTYSAYQLLFYNEMSLRWEIIRGNNDSMFEQLDDGIQPGAYTVTENLQLPTTGVLGASISWSSSDTSLIAANGNVSATKSGYVELIATFSYDGSTRSKVFKCYVSNDQSSTLANWKLDEPSSGTVYDASNNVNGTNHGASVNSDGKIDTAYDFEESQDDYIDFGTGLQLANRNDMSIAAWIKPESIRSGTGLASSNGIIGDTDGQIAFKLQDNGRLTFSWDYANSQSKMPISYWSFNETAAGTAIDDTGDNGGTNNGAAINQTGVVGKAYDFEESENDYVSCGTGLQFSGDATIATWIKPESLRAGTGASSRNVILGDSDNKLLLTLQDGGKLSLMVYEDSVYKTVMTDTPMINAGEWTHVAFTRSDYGLAIYINGNMVKALATREFETLGTFTIGRAGNNADRDFDGLIDDVRVYDRALSSWELDKLVDENQEGDSISTIQADAGDALVAGEWAHVAVTKNDRTTKLYINGELIKTKTDDMKSSFRVFGNMQIGRVNGNKARDFDGIIDDLQVCNCELSASTIQSMANIVPISNWKMDEASGTTVYDSESSNDGTNNGAAITSSGKLSYALDFEESENDYIDLGGGLQLNGTDSMTVSVWVKPESLRSGTGASSRNTILADTSISFILALQDQGRVSFIWDTGDGAYEYLEADAGNAVGTGVWSHIVVTRDGTTSKMFINGVLVKSSSSVSSNNFVSFENMRIGMHGTTSGRSFDGLIDDLRVYSKPLSTDCISALANKGIISYWKMDETSGATVTDSEGGNSGTNSGASINVNGRAGKAYDFEESENDYVDLENGLQLNTTNKVTASAWINPESLRSGTGASSRNTILCDSSTNFIFALQDQGRLLFVWDSNDANYEYIQADNAHVISTGTWTHVAYTRDGSSAKLYINGVLAESAQQSTNNFVAFGDMRIGRHGTTTGRSFDGLIDDVKIFNRALSAEEICYMASQNNS